MKLIKNLKELASREFHIENLFSTSQKRAHSHIKFNKKMFSFCIFALAVVLLPFALLTLPKITIAQQELEQFVHLSDLNSEYIRNINTTAPLDEAILDLEKIAFPLRTSIGTPRKTYEIHYMITDICSQYNVKVESLSISEPVHKVIISDTAVTLADEQEPIPFSLPSTKELLENAKVKNLQNPFSLDDALAFYEKTVNPSVDDTASEPPTTGTPEEPLPVENKNPKLNVNVVNIDLTLLGNVEELLKLTTAFDSNPMRLMLTQMSITKIDDPATTKATFSIQLIEIERP